MTRKQRKGGTTFAIGSNRWAACSKVTIVMGLVAAACAFHVPCCHNCVTYTTWRGGSGNWSDSTKWSEGVPNSSISAYIDQGNGMASPVTLDISGAQAYDLTIDSDDSLSFNNGTSLTINGGGVSNSGNIRLNSTGTSTFLNFNKPATLGGGGTITLTDSANPQNFIRGASSNVTLDNQETIQGAGNIGNGQIGLTNDGTILANASHALSIQPSSSGFTNNGTLQVASGSIMHVFGGPFTNFSGSTLTGGTYNISGKLEIDQLGSTGGEIVTNAASIILTGSASSFVDAAGKDALSKFATNGSAGSFSLQGGRAFTTAANFSTAGTLTIGSGSTFTVGGIGTSFTQTAGTTTDDGTLAVPSSGSLSLNGGSLFGKGAITGAVTSSGTIAPGDSAAATGILKDTGAYTQNSSGTLDISIDGTSPGTQYDQLNPSTASLNGTLNINLPTGFVPAVGNTFKIMNFNAESGKFATVNGLAINSTEHFTITYQGTDVLLTVVSGACCAPQGGSGQFNSASTVGPGYNPAQPSWFGFGLYSEGPALRRLGSGGPATLRHNRFCFAHGRRVNFQQPDPIRCLDRSHIPPKFRRWSSAGPPAGAYRPRRD